MSTYIYQHGGKKHIGLVTCDMGFVSSAAMPVGQLCEPAPTHAPVQVTPSPVKPVLHAQVKEPGVLVHVASEAQSSELSVHSSTSARAKMQMDRGLCSYYIWAG